MKRLIYILVLIPCVAFGQFTATQLHTGIRVNIKNQSPSQLRLANMLDSIVHSMGASSGSTWGSITGTLSNQTDLQNALNLKANLASPTFTGTVSGITASMVGLGNVTNTSDANKPVSTAQQTALDLKANIASPTFTGTPTLPLAVFSSTGSPSYVQGKIEYSTIDQDLRFYNDDSNVALDIGQENWVRVRNTSGSTINNGSPVFINNTIDTNYPTITLANASAIGTYYADGLATEAIANNATGWVAIDGVVRGLNTSGFTAGQTIYVNTTAGTLTNTAPVSPNLLMPVGVVKIVNASTGEIQLIRKREGFAKIGNNTASITTTGATTVTLPTSGTLYGTATGSITSLQLSTSLSDETGTGVNVMAVSPALTGTPTAPTAAAATNTTQIATTAHVFAERSNTLTETNHTIGDKIRGTVAANTGFGTAVLVAGTVTVANTGVSASSIILLTSNVDGGTVGFVRVSSRVNATSFTITSSSGSDTSTIGYVIIN